MSELDDSFARLLGRQPTDKERQALYRVRDALRLKSTDVTVHGVVVAKAVDDELRIGSNRSLARRGIDRAIEM